MRLAPAVPLVLSLLLAACGSDADTGADRGVRVVATTTQAADLARNVVGDAGTVRGLLTATTDPHDYEPRPDDLEALAEADVVVRSGGDLDEWLDDAIEAAGGAPEVVTLIDHVEPRDGSHGHAGEEGEHAGEEGETDPHWWHDPRNAVLAVDAIEQAVTEAAPRRAEAVASAAEAYRDRIEALDTAIAECIGLVPAEQRKLVTTHDALGYFADRFEIEVIGTVIPSLSTQGQPSAGETAELVETVRQEGVKTIFAESSVGAKVEAAIAREAGVEIGTPLYADALGPDGSDGDTYLGSLAANTRAMIEGFTGSPAACSLPSS